MIGGMVRPPGAIPLRPDYSAARGTAAKSLWRGLTAAALAQFAPPGEGADPAKISERHFARDELAHYVARAAVIPLDTTSGAAFAPTMTSALWSALPPFAAS